MGSIPLSVLSVATIFPIYLTINGFSQGNFSNVLFGNSDRSLGVITYITCSVFFLFGYLLKKFYSESFNKIILGLGILQALILGTGNFGMSSDMRQGSFLNTNPSSLLTGLLSVYFLSLIIESKLKYQTQIAFTFFTLTLAILFWINALQAIIGYLITICLLGITKIQRKNFIPLKHYVTAVVTLGVIFLAFIRVSKTPALKESNLNSFSERLDIYKTSLEIILHNFFIGVGVDNFNLGYYRLNQFGNIKLVDNAHSIPLQLFSTLGILGLIIFYVLFYVAFKQSYLKSNPAVSFIRNSLFFYLISGFFAIQTPGLECIVFLMLGYLMSRDPVRIEKKSREYSVRLMLGSVGLVGAILLSSAFLPLFQISQTLSQSPKDLDRSNLVIRENISRVYDIGLLFDAGRYSMLIGDKSLGLLVLQRMMTISKVDQRTIALSLLMASKYDDTNLEKIGTQLNEWARS